MDYLVRCKDFAGCGLVPKMTSNTTPYGEVIADYWPGTAHFPYYAFDDASTAWVSAQNAYSRLTYKFVDQVCVKKFTASIRTTKDNLGISGSIQGSNDGTTWTTLYTFSASAETSKGIGINNSNNYLYYSLLPSSYNYNEGSVYGVRIDDLQFYTETYPLIDSERAMYFIGQNNYASDTLLDDSDWLDAIINSQYVDYILNSKVPVMSSMNTPYGQILPPGGVSSVLIKAFDGIADSSSSRHYAYIGFPNGWMGYQFIDSTKVYLVSWYNNADASTSIYYLINGNIRYSDDGTNWTTILELTNQTGKAALSKFTHILTNTSAHKYWSLQCMSAKCASGDSNFYFNRLQFIGRTDISDPSPEPSGYKALVPTMTSNTTPSGVASSSGGSYNNTAYKAFDADNATYGVALAGNTTDQGNWLMYKFTKPVCVKEFILTDKIGTHTMNTVAMQLQGSNDGSNFYEVYSNSSYRASDDFDTKISIDNDNYYLYYRVYYSGGVQIVSGQYFSYILKLQLYGYEDTSTQYLYNNGTWSVGIENPGSNFNRSGTTYSQGATLASNKFTLPSVSSVGSLIGLQKVDLTNVKIVQVKCKGLSSTTSYYCIIRISDSYNIDSVTKYANITSNQEHTVPIDVSELTGYYYITLACNINMSCEVYEIYLQK